MSTLCPIITYIDCISRRPFNSSTSHLFLNTKDPKSSLSNNTICGWLHSLLKHSSDEKSLSLRSIASSLALNAGIPKEDIVTMGNWFNSATFENHYRRQHLSAFDFTNTLVTVEDFDGDDE